MALRVALVSRDPEVRVELARAFDLAPPGWALSLHEDVPSGSDVVVVGPEVAADGHVRFDPEDPRAAVAEVRRAAAARSGSVVVVAGGAGGCGATTLTLHLAAQLARSRDVCVVDLSHERGAGSRIDVEDHEPDAGTNRERPGDPRVAAVPVTGGFRLLTARPTEGDVVELVGSIRPSFDVLLVDGAPPQTFDALVEIADAVLLVVPPTVPAARRARSLVARHPEARWGIVVNRTGAGGEMTRARIERIIERRVALELPCCPRLRDAEDRLELFTSSWSRWTNGVRRLAAAVDRA